MAAQPGPPHRGLGTRVSFISHRRDRHAPGTRGGRQHPPGAVTRLTGWPWHAYAAPRREDQVGPREHTAAWHRTGQILPADHHYGGIPVRGIHGPRVLQPRLRLGRAELEPLG